MDGVLKPLYKSAFRLLYAHDDHILRVVFIFLNVWWVFVEAMPLYFGVPNDIVLPESFQHLSAITSFAGLIVGFFLLLMRENVFFINLNYILTMTLLFNHIAIELFERPFDSDLGAFVALGVIASVGYLRYNIKQVKTFHALMRRAAIDVDETDKLMRAEM